MYLFITYVFVMMLKQAYCAACYKSIALQITCGAGYKILIDCSAALCMYPTLFIVILEHTILLFKNAL